MAFVSEEKQVKFVAYKLKGGVTTWWNQLQITKRHQSKPLGMTWRRIKQLLQVDSFHPTINKLYTIWALPTRTRTVTTYMKEFYRLLFHCDLSMTDEQAVRYISGLQYPIQERVILYDVFSIDPQQSLERREITKYGSTFQASNTNWRVNKWHKNLAGFNNVDRSPAHQSTNIHASTTTTLTATTAKNKKKISRLNLELASPTGVGTWP